MASRWHYHVGDARALLPQLLARLGRIDMFHHASLHTREHMTWELRTAFGALAEGGVLSSHDVRVAHGIADIPGENAYPAFCRARGVEHHLLRNSGFALKPFARAGAAPLDFVAADALSVDRG